MAHVVFRQELVAADEHTLIPKEHLRKAVRRLEAEPLCGKPLGRKLVGCRSIRVGGVENRLVYRFHEHADLVEVLAIQRRRESEAYDAAEGRV